MGYFSESNDMDGGMFRNIDKLIYAGIIAIGLWVVTAIGFLAYGVYYLLGS